jgi:hypothetical protein
MVTFQATIPTRVIAHDNAGKTRVQVAQRRAHAFRIQPSDHYDPKPTILYAVPHDICRTL